MVKYKEYSHNIGTDQSTNYTQYYVTHTADKCVTTNSKGDITTEGR